MGFFSDDKRKRDNKLDDDKDKSKIILKKEELDIAKHKEKIGEVEIAKEIITERKSVDVPVTREEVIIERKAVNKISDSPITDEEKIHIPVTDEFVDVAKRTVVVGEVSAYKHTIEDQKRVDETLKREEARINTDGDSNILKYEDEEHR